MKSLRQFFINLENTFWQKHRSNLTPSVLQHDYLALASLVHEIKSTWSSIRRSSGRKYWQIVDVGCGEKPYLELFKPYSKKYIGLDIVEPADVIASADKLPYPNNTYDLVLNFQVLEHAEYPELVTSEMKRILKKGGFAMVSTHGIWHYHPFPRDLYRWTHEGLEFLFKDFRSVKVIPNLDSFCTILQLINNHFYTVSSQNLLLKLPLYTIIILLNLLGAYRLHRQINTKQLIDPSRNICVNYLVIARK